MSIDVQLIPAIVFEENWHRVRAYAKMAETSPEAICTWALNQTLRRGDVEPDLLEIAELEKRFADMGGLRGMLEACEVSSDHPDFEEIDEAWD